MNEEGQESRQVRTLVVAVDDHGNLVVPLGEAFKGCRYVHVRHQDDRSILLSPLRSDRARFVAAIDRALADVLDGTGLGAEAAGELLDRFAAHLREEGATGLVVEGESDSDGVTATHYALSADHRLIADWERVEIELTEEQVAAVARAAGGPPGSKAFNDLVARSVEMRLAREETGDGPV